MRKIILAILCIASFAMLSALGVNVSAGLTFPSLSEGLVPIDGTVGFNAGASVLFNSAGAIIIEPGIRFRNLSFFAEAKWNDDEYGESGKEEFTANLNYLDLFAKVKFNPSQNVESNVKMYPFVGFGLGMFLNGKSKIEEQYTYGGYTHIYRIENDFKDTAESMVLGLSIGMDLLIYNNITTGFEYNRTLSSMAKDYTMRSSTLMLNVGYLFSF